MYQELLEKKVELQNKRPYDKGTVEVLKELDNLDYICSAMILDGTGLSRADIQGMMDGEMPKTASLKECIFIKNAMGLLNFMRDSLQLKNSLDAKLLLRFHNILTGEASGFRRSNSAVEKFRHVPPNHMEVEQRLNQMLRNIYRDSTNEIRNASLIHCGILAIYPFEEYSGVIARLAMNYYLQEKGFMPVALGFSEKEYTDTMIQCLSDDNDALFFWGLERAEYNKLVQAIQLIESE